MQIYPDGVSFRHAGESNELSELRAGVQPT
jgi:hypothetical protein